MRVFQRRLHTLPTLRPSNIAGAKQLYSREGFETAWTSAQQSVINKLNAAVVDTDNEIRSPFHIMLNTHTKPEEAHIFNYASRAYSNHLFFDALTDHPKAPYGALERRIVKQFQSFENLKRLIIEKAQRIEGQGCVFLAETDTKQLELFACNNAGTSASYYRREGLNLSNGGTEDDLKILETLKQRVDAKEKSYNVDLLALNLWQHAYVKDYQFDKAAFINRWFDLIDWEVVSDRLFRGRL